MLFSRRYVARALGAAAGSLVAPSVLCAQSPSVVRIATGVTPPSIHNIFLHVAHERGFFRNNGLRVADFIQLNGGPLAIQAMAAGQVDLAPADPEGLLAAAARGHPLRAIAAPGARLSYMVAVTKDIVSLADLRGKPFAISRPGAISQYLMFPLLDGAGVARDSLQWFAVGGARERMLALKLGRAKGALLHIDYAMEAVADPNIRLIKSIAELLPDYPVELMIFRKTGLDQHPDIATAVVKAVIEACRYIVKDKSGTLEVVLKYVPGGNSSVLERAYDELMRIRGFGVNGGMTEANLRVAHDLALQNRQIDQEMPLDRWVDFRFQERALESLGRVPE